MSPTVSLCLLQVANVAVDTVEQNWTLIKRRIDQILAAFWLKSCRTQYSLSGVPLEANKGGEPVDSLHAGPVDLTHCNLISGMS